MELLLLLGGWFIAAGMALGFGVRGVATRIPIFLDLFSSGAFLTIFMLIARIHTALVLMLTITIITVLMVMSVITALISLATTALLFALLLPISAFFLASSRSSCSLSLNLLDIPPPLLLLLLHL